MSKNPVLNSLAATVYIVIVAGLMFNAEKWLGPVDTVLAPIMILSLFTLSAATMAYLFLYQPVLLFLDGRKKEAVQFFLRTLATFAVTTIILFALSFSGIFKASN